MMRLQILSLLATLIASSVGLAVLAGTSQVAPVQLLMVRQEGCLYCAQWEREIGPDYGSRAEGVAAPLMRVHLRGPWPDGLALDSNPGVTPTFILIRDGLETGRIEGYAGEAQFWDQLNTLLDRAGIATAR
ncbi:hypothetical protein SAMN05421538_106201 [Paracoccus isoporae]|uniref:SoxS protein n=2 Tax=Paracoccus isoporae TaxID=591205 RepID=A0A1G7CSU2_9RHOB|nr:hypothetical protein SAMN05421538_106201 [Paracoccus isoporae]